MVLAAARREVPGDLAGGQGLAPARLPAPRKRHVSSVSKNAGLSREKPSPKRSTRAGTAQGIAFFDLLENTCVEGGNEMRDAGEKE